MKKKKYNLNKVYALIIITYIILLILILINLFSIVIQAGSFINGVSKSPIRLTPTLVALIAAALILIIGIWVLFYNYLSGPKMIYNP